jgi:hypothetical protein
MNADMTTALLTAAATSVVAVALWLGLSSPKVEKPVAPRDCDPLDPW